MNCLNVYGPTVVNENASAYLKWFEWNVFENGCYILVVSEPRFRRFYKMILKLFVNDFEIFFMTCIAFAYKG